MLQSADNSQLPELVTETSGMRRLATVREVSDLGLSLAGHGVNPRLDSPEVRRSLIWRG
jgi:hypothetical protein